MHSFTFCYYVKGYSYLNERVNIYKREFELQLQ